MNLPPSLAHIDWTGSPQRSVLMAVTRAARSGWRPGADTLAEIIAYATRALSGHDRLAHRGREALAALGVTETSSAAENAAERNVGGLARHPGNGTSIPDRGQAGLHCPGCKSPSAHPTRGPRWTCSSCGESLRLTSAGRLTRDTPAAIDRRRARR